MPETVPAAYPPRPLETSHSRVRSTSGSAARASDHGIWRMSLLVLKIFISSWDSFTMGVARPDRHAEGPHFSYWLSMPYQRYRPQWGWLLPRCQCRCWLSSGGAWLWARLVEWPHTEYR